jgi:hypothetical protein
MPDFTIHVTDKQLPKLQAVVNECNGNSGTTLTVQEWLDLHVKEVCIQRDLAASVQAAHEQTQKDAQAALDAAVAAERAQLLADLEVIDGASTARVGG